MSKELTVFKLIATNFYDSMIVASIVFMATLILTVSLSGAVLFDKLLFQLFLFSLIYFYFIGFWLKSGQTTGMKAWKVKLVNQKEGKITFFQVNIRFFCSFFSYIFLIGVIIKFFNKNKLSFHDILSKTKLVSM